MEHETLCCCLWAGYCMNVPAATTSILLIRVFPQSVSEIKQRRSHRTCTPTWNAHSPIIMILPASRSCRTACEGWSFLTQRSTENPERAQTNWTGIASVESFCQVEQVSSTPVNLLVLEDQVYTWRWTVTGILRHVAMYLYGWAVSARGLVGMNGAHSVPQRWKGSHA